MIRFKIDLESTEILDKITQIYDFKRDTITARIALSLSIEKGTIFTKDTESLLQNGREYTPTSNIFGQLIGGVDNATIYKAVFNQHYNKDLSDTEFVRLYKLHLKEGLTIWMGQLNKANITKGEHVSFLLKMINKGLLLRTNTIKLGNNNTSINNVWEYNGLLSLNIGTYEDGKDVIINLNDLREFDNRNIAIAGAAGSGKTQLIKDILYQISKKTKSELKFIFFDYKGEGNVDQLKSFLSATNAKFVDIIEDGGVGFNPFHSIILEEKNRPFSIRLFVDTVSMFVPSIGVSQKNILIKLIGDLLDRKDGSYPTIDELFGDLEEYYSENKKKTDSLYSVIRDLSTNIFNCDLEQPHILDQSLYLNLPPALSDTLRQLVVFLLLRYFNTYFSSTNDCMPDKHVFPLRYVIVIDEAHIYLKNKNARKALEDLLRLLRSKGVVVVMLTQGVEDYKTTDFDFASQVQLPICLNVQNKDYKSICNFVGTPTSKYKLETELNKLDSGKGLINFSEPRIINIKQWWRTQKEENL